jgi:predicted short-subunit dehydrogenase-like oxidoreductase (DUF2520 family)
MANGYKVFEDQARQMRDRFIAAATVEADKWLEYTLAMIRRMSGSPTGRTTLSDQDSRSPVTAMKELSHRHSRTLADVTREVIDSIGSDEFDSVQLRGTIAPLWGPMSSPTQRANLANLLRRMVERGDLELVEQGTGSRPSRYRKKMTHTQVGE